MDDGMPNFKKKKKKLAGIKSQMKHMSKEAQREALLKKKKCNDKAIESVKYLIEPGILEEELLKHLHNINQSHLDDIVEERALSKICGYPLCANIVGSVPTKIYHISTKTNKVYDLRDRKNFCSNLCYKAGTYLKNQLYTGPLWLREFEEPVNYKLLTVTKSCDEHGEEVDLGNNKLQNLEEESIMNEGDIQKTTLLEGSLLAADIDLSLHTLEIKEHSHEPATLKESNDSYSEVISSVESFGPIESDSVNIEKSRYSKSQNQPVIEEETRNEVEQIVWSEKTFTLKDVVIKIENIIRSWFTIDTVCFLLGEEKLIDEFSKFDIHLKECSVDSEFMDRFNKVSKKLNEIQSEKLNNNDSLENVEAVDTAEPVSHIKQLTSESKKLEKKVESFYKGALEYEEVSEDQSESNIDKPLPVLPLIDHHEVETARRRIVLHKLNNALPEIQKSLGLLRFNVMEEIRNLVFTLQFTAKNINMKPSEWLIVCLVIIKLISLRDPYLQNALKHEESKEYIELLLMTYTLDGAYLERLVAWLLELNNIIMYRI